MCNNGVVWIRGGNGGVKLFGGNTWLDGNDLAQVRNIFMTGAINPYNIEHTSHDKLDFTSFFEDVDFFTSEQCVYSNEKQDESSVNENEDNPTEVFNKTIQLNLMGIENSPIRDYVYGTLVQNGEGEEQINITNLLMMCISQIKTLQQEIKALKEKQ